MLKSNWLEPRVGQIWQRKKDGTRMIVYKKGRGNSWFCFKIGNQKVYHHITKFDFNKYWELLTK